MALSTQHPTRTPRRFTAAEKAEMVRLYTTRLDDGTWMGATTIAKKLGTNHRSVYYVLKTQGVETRDAAESHAHGKACRPVKNVPTGDAPSCRCGCDAATAWNKRKNRWNVYAEGHHRAHAAYKDAGWLENAYVTERRTCDEIGREFGVCGSTINRWMDKFEIPRRDRSAARVGRQSGADNPAWKGGVADWDYAPEWKRIAREIRNRDEWTCQMCQEQRSHWGHSLHVHHIDGNKLNNDGTNLIAVCASCHPRGSNEVEFAPALRSIAANREEVMPECQS
jgi:transposase-like protein